MDKFEQYENPFAVLAPKDMYFKKFINEEGIDDWKKVDEDDLEETVGYNVGYIVKGRVVKRWGECASVRLGLEEVNVIIYFSEKRLHELNARLKTNKEYYFKITDSFTKNKSRPILSFVGWVQENKGKQKEAVRD